MVETPITLKRQRIESCGSFFKDLCLSATFQTIWKDYIHVLLYVICSENDDSHFPWHLGSTNILVMKDIVHRGTVSMSIKGLFLSFVLHDGY